MTTPSAPPRRLTFAERFPESLGPGSEDGVSGALTYGVVPGVTPGPIPHPSGFGPAERDRDRARQEAAIAALSPAERAAQDVMRRMVQEELRRRV